MSKIERLIKEKCPNGVEYKQIKDVFTLFSGMRGVSSKWADNGNCRFIDYMNAYNNNKIDITKLPFATVKCLNQNTLRQGDILLTSASEIPDECAISSVIEDNINDGIFMDDHLFGLRLNDEYINIVNPIFINYYLSSKNFRENLYKAVRGVTRFYISNNDFVKLKIPIPPIEIQEEIAKILDKFIELEKELEKELESRKKQYKFWNRKLLKNSNIQGKKISQIFNRIKGTPITAKKMKEINEEKGEVRIFAGGKTAVNTSKKNIPSKDIINVPSVIVQSRGLIDFIYYDKPFSFKNEMWAYTCDNSITTKYLYYYLKNNVSYFRRRGEQMGSMPQISLSVTENFNIALPPLQEQEHIVKILDKFDKLINDISEGIPAEIEARRKQYEYYRNMLLSFEELKTND